MAQDESDKRPPCGRCNGAGKEPGTNGKYDCTRCNGTGKARPAPAGGARSGGRRTSGPRSGRGAPKEPDGQE